MISGGGAGGEGCAPIRPVPHLTVALTSARIGDELANFLLRIATWFIDGACARRLVSTVWFLPNNL